MDAAEEPRYRLVAGMNGAYLKTLRVDNQFAIHVLENANQW